MHTFRNKGTIYNHCYMQFILLHNLLLKMCKVRGSLDIYIHISDLKNFFRNREALPTTQGTTRSTTRGSTRKANLFGRSRPRSDNAVRATRGAQLSEGAAAILQNQFSNFIIL